MATAIFLDTTIQIARFLGPPDVKHKIKQQLCCANLTVTSLVVRQEWKRRLLTDARYVLDILRRKRLDVGATLRQIKSKLQGPQNARKFSICLDIIASGFDGRNEITDAGERLENLCVMMLEDGLSLFDHDIHIIRDSGCGCASVDVTTNTLGQYEIGPRKCTTAPHGCGISEFFDAKKAEIANIAEYLRTIPTDSKSSEIDKAEALIDDWMQNAVTLTELSPCLSIGDLVIAIESSGIPIFYTSNIRESKHLTRSLKQNLVILNNNSEEADTGYPHVLGR